MNREEEIRSCLNQLKSRVQPSGLPMLEKISRLTDELTDEIATLAMVNALPAGADIWHEYGLTPMQAKLATALKSAGMNGVTKPGLFDHLYSGEEDPPDAKIIDVMICKIRHQLETAHAPYFIETIHGRGYRMWHGAEAYQKRKQADSKFPAQRAA